MSDNNPNTQLPSQDNNSSDNNRNNKPGLPPVKTPKFNIYWLYIALFAIFVGMQFFNFRTDKVEIDYKTFAYDMLQPGDVEKIVVVNLEFAEIYIKPDKLKDTKYQKYFKTGKEPQVGPQFVMPIGSSETFVKQLDEIQQDTLQEQRVYPSYEKRKDFLGETLSWIFPLLIIIALWMFLFRRMTGGGEIGRASCRERV